jgi:hypothetical protein
MYLNLGDRPLKKPLPAEGPKPRRLIWRLFLIATVTAAMWMMIVIAANFGIDL